MVHRRLGRTGILLSPLGFGAFKIGRNIGAKYPHSYCLPSEAEVEQLLNGVLDVGINYIDTAPAYGLSEERIGRALASPRNEFAISTKVGESFENGVSAYDFSANAVRASIARSRQRLRAQALDIVFVHSDGNDLQIQRQTDVIETLQELRSRGEVRAIGFSGKTIEGARAALDWADAIMVEYHMNDRSHEHVIAHAAKAGVGVIVKKGLASGRLDAEESVRFVLNNPHVTSMVVGGLSLDHVRQNVAYTASMDA